MVVVEVKKIISFINISSIIYIIRTVSTQILTRDSGNPLGNTQFAMWHTIETSEAQRFC